MKQIMFALFFIGFLFSCGTRAGAEPPDWVKKKRAEEPTVLKKQIERQRGTSYGMAEVNWQGEEKYIEVTAEGSPPPEKVRDQADAIIQAYKYAEDFCYELLAETLGGVQVTSRTTYDDEILEKQTAIFRTQAVIQGAVIVDKKHRLLPNGSVLATVKMGLLLSGDESPIIPVTKINPEIIKPEPEEIRFKVSLERPKLPQSYNFLIVDCRKLKIRPAQIAKIYSDNNLLVYGVANADIDLVKKGYMVRYEDTLKEAKKAFSGNPLIVSAIATKGEYNSDVVISTQDAKRTTNANFEEAFLQECRVVFLTNK